MGKKSAPPPPDYQAIAVNQGEVNKDTAVYNANLNRVNQIGPNGSSTWTLRPGADPKNPQPGDYTQTIALTPDQQRLQTAVDSNLAQAGETMLPRVNQALGQNFDTSKLQNIDDLQAVRDAVYSRMQPQLANNRSAAETRLLNSGIEKGTEAWNRAQRTLGQNENDAIMQSVLAGSDEQTRLQGVRQGQVQEQAYLRQLPLNELNALRSGAQVQSPQFGGYYTGSQAAAPNIYGAAQDSFQAGLGATNAYNAAAGNNAQAGASVAAAVIAAY